MIEDPVEHAPARRKRRRFPEWSHGPIYAGVRAGAAMVNMAGVAPSMRFLRRLGGAYARAPINRKRLQRACENISWCFPALSASEVHEHAVESYRHLFCFAAELAMTPRLMTEDSFATHCVLGDLAEGLRALCSGRPCILITGHCGNWELLGYALAVMGFPMHALYRPLDLAPLDAWMHETRSRGGVVLVDKFGAAKVLPSLLEAGRPVGFIADQNAGDKGIFVPFFNRLASAYKTIGVLAMQYDATIICGHACRVSQASMDPPGGWEPVPGGLTGGVRYRLDVLDVFGPEAWAQQPDPLFYITARYRRAIEQMVRRAPEQYLWMHRYWKSRPPHERRGRPFPAQLREKIASLPWIDDDDVSQIVDRSERDAAALFTA